MWGSPPLVRERLVSIVMARLHVGITPARAGKTMHRRLFPGQCWDHPRSCGKDSPPTNLLRNGLGSPPLVRERRTAMERGTLMTRITPARAGKTPTSYHFFRSNRDHPRSCGKDISLRASSTGSAGSPPLVRERLAVAFFITAVTGITPARAGKTFLYS